MADEQRDLDSRLATLAAHAGAHHRSSCFVALAFNVKTCAA